MQQNNCPDFYRFNFDGYAFRSILSEIYLRLKLFY
jgi:hypothetical protein